MNPSEVRLKLFGISGTELFIIVVFALLIFGPDKLPEIGRTIGKFMNEFKRAQDSMESMIRQEMYGKESDKPTVAPQVPSYDDEDDEEEEEEE